MSDWTSNEAREFLSIIRGEAEKVVKDFGDRQSSVYSCLAVVTAISTSGDISVRLLSSPADGSQDFVVRNRSGSTLEVGDSVWLHYWGDYTNVYIAMRNEGGDVLALPYDAVSSNLLINGGFDVWQRGTSFSAVGYIADRWIFIANGTGATRAITQQAFTVGQTDVPENPQYYVRYAQSVAGNSGTYNVLQQRVENVRLLSGKSITLSYYAKAAASTSIFTYANQNFGSGGSSDVGVMGATISVGTSWVKYTQTFDIPSVTGKTVGANNYTYFGFFLPNNATFTVDIANVQLNYGSVALPFVPRSFADELRLCQRYYLPVVGFFCCGYALGTSMSALIPTPVPMRVSPSVAATSWDAVVLGTSVVAITGYTGTSVQQNGVRVTLSLGSSIATPTSGTTANMFISLDAEL